MRTRFLDLGKQSIIYGLSGAVLQLVGLVTLPVYARHFGPAQYGILEIATVGFTALIVAVDAGLGSALQRYWFAADGGDSERRLVAATATWSSFVFAIAVAIPIILFRNEVASALFGSSSQSTVVVLVTLSVPMATLAIFMRDVLRARFRPGQFAISATLGGAVAALVGVYAVVVLDGGPAAVMAGLLAGQTVAALYAWILVRRDVPARFSSALLKKLLAFGLPLIPAAAALWAVSFLDRIMLSQLDGLEATGQYAIAARFASVLMFFTGAFATAYIPFLFNLHEADANQERELRARLLPYMSAMFLGVALVVALSAREIAAIVAPGFGQAYEAVGILCLGVAAYGLFPLAAAGITLTKKTPFIALFTLVALVVSAVLCLILIPLIGLQGAATATALSYVLLVVLCFAKSSKLDAAPFGFATPVALFVVCAGLMVTGVVDYQSEALGIAVRTGALLVYVGCLFGLGVIGKQERAELLSGSRRLRERLSS